MLFRSSDRDRVLVVEDVLTTGGSTKETIEVARNAGGYVEIFDGTNTLVDQPFNLAVFC